MDHRVDLYALGVIFYELLTGQLPLGRFEPPSSLRADVDGRLDAVVLKTLSRKPADRYQHAVELESAVDELLTMPRPVAPGSVHATTAHPRRKAIGVPFTCDALSGFAEAVGIVHARDGQLCAEFRIRDAFGGSVKSKTHLVEIPRENLTKLEFVPGLFGSKLVVSTDTIAALGAFPEAETGRAHLKVKRTDDESARELVQALGFTVESPLPSHYRRSRANQDANRMIFAVLMLICGVLNGGGLAIAEAFVVEELKSGAAFVAAAVGIAVAVGPIAVLQILTGILNLFAQPRALNLASSVASMIPLTPIWLLSFPVGVWAYRWLSDETSTESAPAAQPWGTTTMMFLRESRWSKVVGLLNAVGAIVLLAAITIYNFGCYSTTIGYRVVGDDVSHDELEQAVRARLVSVRGTQHLEFDSRTAPQRLNVRTWERYRDPVESVLTVAEPPQWVWLQIKSNDSEQVEPPASQLIPIAPQLATRSIDVHASPLGRAAVRLTDAQTIESDWVRSIQVTPEGTLVVTLSAEGRSQLESTATTQTAGALAMVVDELVMGLAAPDQVSHEAIQFQLATPMGEAGLTADELAAGIRGPRLPSSLEQVR